LSSFGARDILPHLHIQNKHPAAEWSGIYAFTRWRHHAVSQ